MENDNKSTDMPHDMQPADSFDAFFELNADKIHQLIDENDHYELLYAMWFGGYDSGLREMSRFSRSLYSDIIRSN